MASDVGVGGALGLHATSRLFFESRNEPHRVFAVETPPRVIESALYSFGRMFLKTDYAHPSIG